MPKHFATLAEILGHDFDTVIDVRSPAEFAEDHIPGAVSMPALSNEERAIIGAIYVQDSAFKARKLGAAMVARNVARHLEGPMADKDGGWRPLIYCWRGGQRSGSFASILTQVGWRAETIEGGYRAYRRQVVATLHDQPLPHRLILLDGNTGTAKTDILALLGDHGIQTVDLEGLAKHRGSVFGPLKTPQPSQKSFDTQLAAAFADLDPAKPVVVEAESSKIGQRLIPPSIWAAMRTAPRIRVRAPLEARAEYLTRAYADMLDDPENMKTTIGYLRRLQGAEVIENWQSLVDAKDYKTLAADLMQRHYDPRYEKSRSRGDPNELGEVKTTSLHPDALENIARQIVALINK
ncbi:MAG: tRNA 2-selenouridine(34) synthase MnmH [Paracoccaceae bacterium]